MKWLLYAIGWICIFIWIFTQQSWSFFVGPLSLCLGMVVAGEKDDHS